jgi:hypothetical protein
MHLHVHINLGGDGREEVKLGDGTLLKLALKWGPFIAGLFGVKLPPLPDFTTLVSDDVEREHVTGE